MNPLMQAMMGGMGGGMGPSPAMGQPPAMGGPPPVGGLEDGMGMGMPAPPGMAAPMPEQPTLAGIDPTTLDMVLQILAAQGMGGATPGPAAAGMAPPAGPMMM